MFEVAPTAYLILFLSCALTVSLLNTLLMSITGKRLRVIERLRSVQFIDITEEEDILKRPLLERTLGSLARWLVKVVSTLTPNRLREDIHNRLDKAGNPKNMRAGDVLAIQGILAITSFIVALFGFGQMQLSWKILLIVFLFGGALYLPLFILTKIALSRQNSIKRSLPDIMDLLVVSVEAGLSFEMALMKVVERFQGVVAEEFQRALGEIQLGKPRREALRDMADRVDMMELTSLINAVVQSEQLGVGLSHVLRMQADLIRDKRQQYIEEQAMKAPIKLLFPLVFFIFPSIFIVLLGPALLNILKVLRG